MICALFDRETKEVEKSFVIVEMAQDSEIIFTLENIGPLITAHTLTPKATPILELEETITGMPTNSMDPSSTLKPDLTDTPDS
jgi:hypothetical protein